ncbi:hypothetical protein HU200_045755 [Digitaria exilis]|uniref:DUF7595 domain-containing protein n=1 Tax=Digitaria exilis TaxID=1010633 RepID=A0A835B049_9POAL|nr:hypothetical protein HU200_045755 [Digitaria exilis]
MVGGGGGVSSLGAQAGGRPKRQTPPLPLDILLEIAARSDPATLIRCAATGRDMRRRAADPAATFRLRHTGGRFVLPLLRGHLTGPTYRPTKQAEATTTSTCSTPPPPWPPSSPRLVFPPPPHGEETFEFEPLDSRGGLVLLALTTTTSSNTYSRHLRVCDPVTRHSHTFPLAGTPLSSYGCSYVLFVGGEGGGAGQPSFRVLEARLDVLCLRIQTYSSEHGAWGPRTSVPAPGLDVGYDYHLAADSKPLVVGDVVHWLYLTPSSTHVIMLHVGATSPRAKVTTLPASFPRAPVSPRYTSDWNYGGRRRKHYSYLLATATPGGTPVVLVADDEKVTAWPQYKGSKIWKQQPWTVIDSVGELPAKTISRSVRVKLECFAETSGALLIRIYDRGFFWLDLQSKAISCAHMGLWETAAWTKTSIVDSGSQIERRLKGARYMWASLRHFHRRATTIWAGTVGSERHTYSSISTMAGGGGSGRRKRQTPALPLDVLAEIAARSVDPATVVRCAATCRDMCRRAADESFRRRLRLRLRHTAGGFVLPLLRGHLMGPTHGRKDEQYMVDTAAAAATTRLTSLVFPPPPTPPIDGAPPSSFRTWDRADHAAQLAQLGAR